MLSGRIVTLRALRRDDLAIVYPELDDDPVLHATANLTPWRPLPAGRRVAAFDQEIAAGADRAESAGAEKFAVQRRDDPMGRPIGTAVVWGIDQHQRIAHLGLRLLAGVRGQGLGRDVLYALCRYAFQVRDLHRVQLETLASNLAMQRAALAAGFDLEGRLRESAYLMGRREDELVYGLLAAAWWRREEVHDLPEQPTGA